ncbi:NAD(P)/FAD-dependent oxidoreductase [Aquibacillus koreensis]|uniref:Ferredoxin--NADP reductase n=1 Tax=Aquibacillus koreensis TaxID=279446 RepID=A0A9X3WR04_9BACI|nr:NAD(P)/FAD-dependent oxidoreductase [Aquibacillus koreensis]MCT2535496.1 NAD(P)/FAD-dependent oxidoreductase [Aquibacillus koreensis]MDC3422691.1 NAD(P)/FAD-dependent oxidoreductase [Aquibacillus koreensis]
MTDTSNLDDVIIIGGGSTGLYTAFYCGMRGMKTKLIESDTELGGKVAKFLPEKLIYDIGGIPQITGDELVKQTIDQAAKHQPTIVQNEWIETIKKNEDGTFSLTSKEGMVHHSKTVIIATGTGKFDTVQPDISNIELYTGKSHHYTMKNPQQYVGKRVMICSNNRIGVDWALTLEGIAEQVYLVNNKKTFQNAADVELEQLDKSSVVVKLASEIGQLDGDEGWLDQIIIKSEQAAVEQIDVDHLLTYHGLKMNPTPFDNWGLETDSNRVVVDHFMATNIEGIFAAGDATSYPGKTMLIASGYTEALTAVNSAKKHLEPNAPSTVYSTVIYRK